MLWYCKFNPITGNILISFCHNSETNDSIRLHRHFKSWRSKKKNPIICVSHKHIYVYYWELFFFPRLMECQHFFFLVFCEFSSFHISGQMTTLSLSRLQRRACNVTYTHHSNNIILNLYSNDRTAVGIHYTLL